ncbi:MAG: serine/threonine protein kinase [Pseudomonadota bacterium]|nr:serine/threonine protein kinase [Pseudomonadota bacterium]
MATKASANPTKFRWAPAPRTARTGYLWRNPIFLTGLVAVAMLLVAGFWIHHATEDALRDRFREGLETVAATNTAGLKFWVENELNHAERWAELPDVLEAAKRLMRVASDSADLASDLLNVPVQAELLASLQTLVDSENYDGFALVSRDGVVLASSIERQVGRRLSADGVAAFSPVLRGKPALTRPYQRGELLEGLELVLDQPIIAAMAPVRDEHGKVVAAFVLLIQPEKDFTRILSIARLGKTGDTYAFDRNGLMLSDSRYDEQLTAIGLVPDTPGARSILRVQLRDPGGDMTRGYRPDKPLAERPLTKLVSAAVNGDSTAGVILDAYRDYRGVQVVGTYRWLPKYGIGLATEVSVDAARAVTRPLQLMVFGLLGLLLVSALLIFVSSYALQFLRQRVEQVKQLGQYTLERKIGVGGMGEVYLARHAMLRRPTAVKFIRAGQVSEENLEHFEREVQSSSLLSHPNTIEIYDYGRTDEGFFYYVMEYLPGLTLAGLMELEDVVPPARTIYILRQMCASLAEAHARGFVHRDVKPPNIILTERGGRFDFVKVLDFGLVREVSVPEAEGTGTVHEVAGTPPYIAPERLKDPSCMDPRSDLFSVGVIAFNLVTGKQPFEGNTPMEIVYHCANTPAPRPCEVTDQEIPLELDQLIVDCMAVDPEQRPANADVIIARLDAIAVTERWDQAEARNWWAGNAKRVGTAGHEVAVSAVRAIQQAVDAVPDGVSS